ncbi:uncharacterized protein LOC117574258 [Drosophila albomicans]|uniref:Uncharacterized protein LOC117574258 n=1 Tax=Drosophila albomicans TaxID=7291 RepID=A0A6P8XRE3_DROAB|nr:uncharacterized protein LOC117574258 [Drosophila albomicans]
MLAREEKYTKYLNEHGVLPRLLEILQQLVDLKPLPIDPQLEILHTIGCPLIPQSQMKALERKVSRAQEELRYLRRVLIDLGGQEYLYDSDNDEDDYVGQVGEMGAAPLYSPDPTNYEESIASNSQYTVEASINLSEGTVAEQQQSDEQPSCSQLHPNAQEL